MARKQAIITIAAEGRDHGKVFVVTEMPASRAEKWAMRAFLAMSAAGVEIPENIARMGIIGLVTYGLQAFGGIPFAAAEPLLDEMMECVRHMPDPRTPEVVRNLVEDDIEEIATRLFLRKKILDLHTDFLLPAASSTSTSEATGSSMQTT